MSGSPPSPRLKEEQHSSPPSPQQDEGDDVDMSVGAESEEDVKPQVEKHSEETQTPGTTAVVPRLRAKGKSKRKKEDTNDGRSSRVVTCKSCRLKKLRCDRELPCSNCSLRGLECIFDHGRPQPLPPSRKLASHLERNNAEIARLRREVSTLVNRLGLSPADLEALSIKTDHRHLYPDHEPLLPTGPDPRHVSPIDTSHSSRRFAPYPSSASTSHSPGTPSTPLTRALQQHQQNSNNPGYYSHSRYNEPISAPRAVSYHHPPPHHQHHPQSAPRPASVAPRPSTSQGPSNPSSLIEHHRRRTVSDTHHQCTSFLPPAPYDPDGDRLLSRGGDATVMVLYPRTASTSTASPSSAGPSSASHSPHDSHRGLSVPSITLSACSPEMQHATTTGHRHGSVVPNVSMPMHGSHGVELPPLGQRVTSRAKLPGLGDVLGWGRR